VNKEATVNKQLNWTRARFVEDYADEVLAKYQKISGYETCLPIPVQRIAEELFAFRCESYMLKGSGNPSGAYMAQAKRIIVNECDSIERQRFTIAHELGHIILHSKPGREDVYWNGKNRTEVSAEEFAAALLIPLSFIRTATQEYSLLNAAHIPELAARFLVSKLAMVKRVLHLAKYPGGLMCPVDMIELSELKEQLQSRSKQINRKQKRVSMANSKAYSVDAALPQNCANSDDLSICSQLGKWLLQRGFYSHGRRGAARAEKPAEVLGRPLVIEFAGTPKAGKDTQIEILQNYLEDVWNFRVKVQEEGYRSCELLPIEETHINKFYWSMGLLIKELISVLDQPQKHDVFIFNRALFDSRSFLHFYRQINMINKQDYVNHARFLLTKRFTRLIDVVLLITVPPHISISRQDHSSNATVRTLVQELDIMVPPKPLSNVCNEHTLNVLNDSYSSIFNHCREKKTFSSLYHFHDDGNFHKADVAIKLVREFHEQLPAYCPSAKEIPLATQAWKASRGKGTVKQLALPGIVAS
jgi:Zn-dependent peptidase ImmA (M78 family)